jgi:hypothetical protein
MSRQDDIAREYLQASGADMMGAIHRMAATICNARDRVEEHLPDKGMGSRPMALLWRDLHPNTPRDTKEVDGG